MNSHTQPTSAHDRCDSRLQPPGMRTRRCMGPAGHPVSSVFSIATCHWHVWQRSRWLDSAPDLVPSPQGASA